jgi:hypothetical protein
MPEIPDSTVEATAKAIRDAPAYGRQNWPHRFKWEETGPGHTEFDRNQYRIMADAALQAALDEGGIVLRSKFQDVCDYLLAWTGFNEYCLVNITTLDQLVPKFKYDSLREAAQAVYDVANRDTDIFRRLKRELERG